MKRPNRKTWVRGAALLAVVLTSTASLGQAPPSAGGGAASTPSAVAAQVNAHFDAGLAALDRKDWKKAADEFGKAYALKPLPQIAGNLAEAELKLGRYRDAAEHAEKFLREFKGASTQDKKDGKAWLDEARKKIVTLKITVEGTGVEVLIDGKVVGISPLPPEVYVDPGKHTVEARSGTARDEATDTYEAGWVRVMKLVPKEPAVGPVATATPTASVTPTPGGSGGEQGGPQKEVVIGLGVGAGVALIAGGIFAGVSAVNGAEADRMEAELMNPPTNLQRGDCAPKKENQDCNNLLSTVTAQNALATASMWSFIGAGVLGAATLGYWFLSPRKTVTGAQPVRAGAFMNGSGGKLILEGSW